MTSTQLPFDLTSFIANLPSEPGIYQMLDAEGTVLYVGKAKHLKKRVSSYFNKTVSPKTAALVSQIQSIRVQVTRSETEALLLENSLIKTCQPKYNVLMRDDKSYPFLYLSLKHRFPRLESVRCKKRPEKEGYFGPFPSVAAVRETLTVIQKVFKIRNCSDIYFNSRSRPCLQYQIKRCTAPCTGYITPDAYHASVQGAMQFLQGKSPQILNELAEKMAQAVAQLAFEEAVVFRDQIKSLRLVQEQQGVVQLSGDLDIVVADVQWGFACVVCVSVRQGEVIGHHRFFPSMPKNALDDDLDALWQSVFTTFLHHYYLSMPQRIPKVIVTDRSIDSKEALQLLLNQSRGRQCMIQTKPRGINARWLDFALNNLQVAVNEFQVSSHLLKTRFETLQTLLNLSQPIERMECFDISHTQGQDTVASCVVFDEKGPCKREYRRFNITGITPGDDYAAMAQAITRRFKRLAETQRFPTLLVIDGGHGQVSAALRVIDELVSESVHVIGIAKGPDRKAGRERLIIADEAREMTLSADSPALQLLQHIRDEAHRFAISAHRQKRDKRGLESSLMAVEGIGPKRKKALLHRFGGLRELANAPIEEIAKVTGISRELAVRIYQHFR